MKQKDILTIAALVLVSAFVSVVLSKVFITSPKNRSQQVEVVDKITSNFPAPSNKYFNDNSVDPTKLIQIGDSPNPQPFKP